MPPWWLPLAALAIIAGSAVAVWLLNDYARTRVEAQTSLAHIGEEAGEQLVLAHELPLREGMSDADAEENRENRAEIEEVTAELARIDPENGALARVDRAYGEFEAALEDEMRLVEEGRTERAREVVQERVDPSFESHHDAINAAQAEYEDLIRASERAASIGTAALALFAMVAVGLLFFRYERARRAQVIQRSEERFRSLVQNSSDVITIVGADDRVRYQSPSLERVLGYSPDEMVGRDVLGPELVHMGDAGKRDAFVESLRRPGSYARTELRLRDRDGSWRYFELIGQNLLDDPNLGGVVINSRDATERRALEERLRYQALHDALTNLPNRTLLMDRIGQALAREERGGAVAVLFADLDRFKAVNDSLGHEAGDRLLAAVADRLLGCTRPGDTVARLSGDEFVILLQDVEHPRDAERVAERILETVRAPFEVGGREVFVTASVGVVHNATGDDREDLLRNADIAMYAAKKRGKNRYEVYDPTMGLWERERLTLESDLRRAVEREEFEVHYQPKLSLFTGGVTGVEALVRWRHPTLGLVQPEDFISLAEETGLIVPIGLWVLEAACRDARAWPANLLPDDFDVSVNLSARQFWSEDLAQDVSRVLQRTGLSPRHLTLEITENAIMDHAPSTVGILEDLRYLGVGLAIDDFGTGYSSLSYLRRFPVDFLKIDRSFVAGLGEDPDASAVVSSILSLAASLKLAVVAEGVESACQLDRLRDLGCDVAQGYYLSPPLPPQEIPGFVRAQSDAPVRLRRSHA